MGDKDRSPDLRKDAFHCPLCDVYAPQEWRDLAGIRNEEPLRSTNNFLLSFCGHCDKPSIWLVIRHYPPAGSRRTPPPTGVLIYPRKSPAPDPAEDMPEAVSKDYKEAASIVERSPRAAAALLRLAIERLCQELGADGKRLNDQIGDLVEKGLPPRVQKALDIVRVIGNESVHPGQIDLDDDRETANSLFDLLNVIVHETITRPRELDELYSSLPASKLNGINNRDNKKKKPSEEG